jgi:hypothetical protein
MRAERRLGEIIKAQKETVGLAKPPGINQYVHRVSEKPDAPISLADAGIDKNLANRARKAARYDGQDFEDRVAEGRAKIQDLVKDITHMPDFTGDNEWYTPPEYIEAARAVLGAIDLDPASNAVAQEVVRAGRYFTIETNGLKQEWRGGVWLNPPYSQRLISNFVSKLCDEYNSGRVTDAIMLTNN